jgi:PAS domain S-box-containing protein
VNPSKVFVSPSVGKHRVITEPCRTSWAGARPSPHESPVAACPETCEVLERISDGYFAFDREWRFTYVNAAAERITGQSRHDLLGRSLWESFPETIHSPIYAAHHQAMDDGISSSAEFYYPPLQAWFEATSYPAVDGITVYFRDVTAGRRLQRELLDSEARYRTLVEHLPMVVYLLNADRQQTALYFSPQFEQLTGLTPEEAINRPSDWHWITTVHPDDQERVAREDERTVAAGEPYRMEYRYLRKDGSYVWVLDECLPVRDETGEIIAWQGVLIDITDRIKAEEVQARLAAIVEGAEDAIISRTVDGTITSWNYGAERLYGYRADEVIGQSFTILLPYDEDWSEIAQIEDFDVVTTQFEARRLRKDGAIIDVSIAMSPIRDANGKMIGTSTITRDITRRKQLEQQLRNSLDAAEAGIRAKTLFLAMMSHELRTPLQAVFGYADLLLLGAENSLSPEQIEDVCAIRNGARRMITLIEQLLDLSRMEAGRLQLADQPVDLGQIVEAVMQDIAPQAAAKRIDLSVELLPSSPIVHGDPDRLRQILLNLVGNAVKFTEQGSVRISQGITANGVAVSVTDTGIGISTEALPYIFEEFRQVDGSLTRRYGGAGLGLAIARKLADHMGGEISVTSTPGVGSTFTLSLGDGAGVHLGQMTETQSGHPSDGAGAIALYAGIRYENRKRSRV